MLGLLWRVLRSRDELLRKNHMRPTSPPRTRRLAFVANLSESWLRRGLRLRAVRVGGNGQTTDFNRLTSHGWCKNRDSLAGMGHRVIFGVNVHGHVEEEPADPVTV